MQRDWDCIRAILLAVEALGDTQSAVQATSLPEYDAEKLSHHIRMMMEAGLVVGKCSQGMSGPLSCWATRLTWEGHEFLDKIRSDTVWNKVKGFVREKGLSLSFDVIKITAKHVIETLLS